MIDDILQNAELWLAEAWDPVSKIRHVESLRLGRGPARDPLRLGWLLEKWRHTSGFKGLRPASLMKVLQCAAAFKLKGRSHYSDNQSPTSNNHYFWVGCRKLSEVGKCLSMIGDWLSENYIDNLSPTSDNHPFSGWFSMVGKWLLMIAGQFWSVLVGFRCSINNHRQPNKAAIQNEYTFDPEKCRWSRNRGRVVLSWSATGRRLVVGADLHNQLYHPHFKRNSNMYSWNCPRMVVKM